MQCLKLLENQGKEKEYKSLRINDEQLTMFDDFFNVWGLLLNRNTSDFSLVTVYKY